MKDLDYQNMVRDFMEAGGWDVSGMPKLIAPSKALIRIRLMAEELAECIEAICLRDLTQIARELVDLLYVVFGTAVVYGVPVGMVFEVVHEYNMLKFRQPVIDAGGKYLKPLDFDTEALEAAIHDVLYPNGTEGWENESP